MNGLSLEGRFVARFVLILLSIISLGMGSVLNSQLNGKRIKSRFTFFSFSASHFKVNLFQNSPDKFLFLSKPISIPEMTEQIERFSAGQG